VNINNNINNKYKAKKRFGQNFLTNEYYLNNIITQINACSTENIIEIGPGLGALTGNLLDKVASITAIEIDKDCIEYLNKNYKNKKLNIIEKDVLKIDFPELIKSELIKSELIKLDINKDKKIKIIGNLPYNISSPLIIKLLPITNKIQDMTFLLQKEVVDRLSASPNNKQYGRLSIIAQYFCDVTPLCEIPPEAFSPAPKVQSKLVRLTSRSKTITPELKDITSLEKVTRIAFNQRRKQLKSALKQLFSEDELMKINIDPKLRPENLEIKDYIKLANLLSR